MKVGRSVGVILSLLIVMLFTNRYIDGKSYSRYANNNEETNIAYDIPDQILGNSSDNKEGTITYKNEFSYPIYLNQSSIKIKCTGYGDNKEDDEELVKSNLQIKVLFSKDKKNKSESIRLEKNDHHEYVKQATKTSVDSYITPLLMENKVVTKMILRENGLPVPNGVE